MLGSLDGLGGSFSVVRGNRVSHTLTEYITSHQKQSLNNKLSNVGARPSNNNKLPELFPTLHVKCTSNVHSKEDLMYGVQGTRFSSVMPIRTEYRTPYIHFT